MKTRCIITFLSVLFLITAFSASALGQTTITIDTVPVGDPGNAPDTEVMSDGTTGYGSLSYIYNMGKYEVTAAQYTDFLNHVAATDTYGLYTTRMIDPFYWGCKIQRSGSPGSYTYRVAADWANRPVNWVSYWDACRFANWLHNGQPTGAQNASTTEDGAYAINRYNGTDGRTIQRKADWKWAVTSEDEWYKAAYYKGTSNSYWDYPMQSDVPTLPSNDLINPDPGNNANFFQSGYTITGYNYRTEAGEFENSASHYGTFDQGGNVWEWNEAMPSIYYSYAYRGLRGGSFYSSDGTLLASYRDYYYLPTYESQYMGFRVSAVPEPSSILILGSGLLALAGFIRRKR